MSKPQDQLISLAIQELNRVLQDVKNGKTPEMSASIQKLSEELEKASPTMNEEEAKTFAENIIHKINQTKQ